MGLFGALENAVLGLKAQSYAIDNISGNIANSQTTGFKRVDTSFSDLVPETPANQPLSGSTFALGETIFNQGDIKNTGINTNVAINGAGYFVGSNQVGTSDGRPVFSGTDIYTRRGDFQLNRFGFLVNGAGNYLKGLPIDPKTGNPTGSVPQVIQVATDFQAASPTTQIDYRANLAKLPLTADFQSNVPGSELLNSASFPAGGNPITTSHTGTASSVVAANNFTNIDLTNNAGDKLTFNITLGSAAPVTITLDRAGSGAGGAGGDNIYTIDEAISEINHQLTTAGLAVTAGKSGGKLTFTANTVGATALTVNNVAIVDGGGAGANHQNVTDLGVTTPAGQTDTGTNAGNGIVLASDNSTFVAQTVEGGGITVFDSSGSSLNVQFRWAKISDTPGAETWNLFYLSNSAATGSQTMWTNVGQDYVFNGSGQLTPPITAVDVPNFTINGTNLGTITLQHGENGITQFQDPNGTAQLTTLDQNGFPAGQLSSIAVEDGGALVGTYSNGRTQKLAQIVLADFKGEDFLQRIDGGAYAVTQSSGQAIIGATGKIVGGSVEASNTDIADEFSKLIVTQQAYTANTRTITAADQMLNEVINIIR